MAFFIINNNIIYSSIILIFTIFMNINIIHSCKILIFNLIIITIVATFYCHCYFCIVTRIEGESEGSGAGKALRD